PTAAVDDDVVPVHQEECVVAFGHVSEKCGCLGALPRRGRKRRIPVGIIRADQRRTAAIGEMHRLPLAVAKKIGAAGGTHANPFGLDAAVSECVEPGGRQSGLRGWRGRCALVTMMHISRFPCLRWMVDALDG